MILTDEQVEQLSHICVAFGTSYQRLRGLCASQRRLFWQVKPKTHKMQHFPMYAAIVNPYYLGCYAGEGLIGSACKAWQRSVAGRWRPAGQRNVLAKRSLSVWLRFDLGIG